MIDLTCHIKVSISLGMPIQNSAGTRNRHYTMHCLLSTCIVYLTRTLITRATQIIDYYSRFIGTEVCD